MNVVKWTRIWVENTTWILFIESSRARGVFTNIVIFLLETPFENLRCDSTSVNALVLVVTLHCSKFDK